jgi:hypothetical protein
MLMPAVVARPQQAWKCGRNADLGTEEFQYVTASCSSLPSALPGSTAAWWQTVRLEALTTVSGQLALWFNAFNDVPAVLSARDMVD